MCSAALRMCPKRRHVLCNQLIYTCNQQQIGFSVSMHKNHIERLKSKIREMEVTSLASKARLKASEDRLEQEQRTIDSNAVLLQTLQAQHLEK